MKKKIYISNFSGLGNRLESLVNASLIQDRFGHSILLSWPEKDSLRIAGTGRGRIMPWERIGAVKLRDFDAAGLEALAGVRVINLRSTYGPRELQRQYTLRTAARLSPHPRIATAIRDTFARFGDRPAVAVHLRQGDFQVSGDTYDAVAHRHPAPGLWWYEHVMRAYAKAFPGVYFVLGYSGETAALEQLRKAFEIVSLPPAPVFEYRRLLPGHGSAGHPVVDLFGLACCTTLIATPTSSFSNWAANMLGPRTRSILPPPRTTRSAPRFGVAELRGGVSLDWRETAERGTGVAFDAALPPPSPPETGWLFGQPVLGNPAA
jgi:hypothetical protein